MEYPFCQLTQAEHIRYLVAFIVIWCASNLFVKLPIYSFHLVKRLLRFFSSCRVLCHPYPPDFVARLIACQREKLNANCVVCQGLKISARRETILIPPQILEFSPTLSNLPATHPGIFRASRRCETQIALLFWGGSRILLPWLGVCGGVPWVRPNYALCVYISILHLYFYFINTSLILINSYIYQYFMSKLVL